MVTIEIHFTLPIVYSNPYVTLNRTEHAVLFQIETGGHVAQPELFELGTVHYIEGRQLLAQFSFEYTYDAERRVVTVCGTNFNSARAMCMTTVPAGTTEYCYQRATGKGFEEDNLRGNTRWNYRTPLTPGLEEIFANVVKTVNDRLISALENTPRLNVQVRTSPPTLSIDDHAKFVAVYLNGQFRGIHVPTDRLGPQDEVFTIASVFGGEVTLGVGEAFSNVIGSTNDPKIAGLTWLQLWANQFQTYPARCASYRSNGFACGASLVGGHVIEGTQVKVVPRGSDSVWILPICVQHNNNNNVYMRALEYRKGIWLKNYLGR